MRPEDLLLKKTVISKARWAGSRHGRRPRHRLTLALAAVLGVIAVAPAGAHAGFQIGLNDLNNFQPPTAGAAFGAMRSIHGSVVRLVVPWRGVAPAGTTKPAGFVDTNPGDPHYNWREFDAAVRAAAQRGLQVLMTLYDAPAWAEGPHRPANAYILPGAWEPGPVQFADFVHAAAVRYGGHYPDPLHPGAYLPRVKDWEIWNEQNLPYYLAAPNLVEEYRALLNGAYAALKAVNPGNVVVAGGLAPVSFLAPLSMSPLQFAAELLCLRRAGTAFVSSGACPVKARFDVFAHHPYTLAATPTKPAYNYDDVLVGDMGKLKALLRASDRLHSAAPDIKHQLWITEWGWVTHPPNNVLGDANATAARYVAWSMYEMWHSGARMVIWQTIRDGLNANPPGGGLYTLSGRPKLTLRAFTFPVVAAVHGGRGFAWGRAPVSRRVRVQVQRFAHHRWRGIATARTGTDGVFYVRFPARGNGRYRAHIERGATSLAYDSKPIPPRRTHLNFYSG